MTEPRQRRRYKNPPIEEALVEFRMVPGQDWDLTIPGKLHERVKASYQGKPRQQKLFQASVQAVHGEPTGLAMHEGVVRVQLVDSDGRKLLSLGADVLSVNVLKPYDSWENFKPRIDDALRAYVDVSGAEKVSRIGVRYINKVVLEGTDIDLPKYFLCGPSVPPGLPRRVGGFLNRAEHVFEDGVKVLVTFASIDAGENKSAFLLDLDVVWEGAVPLDTNAALEKVDDLHEREGIAFEALITDETRAIFDAA
jgi:uncharacterized protein (TIGR04255 family)